MSCVYLRVAIEDARVGPQGVKEAVAMCLEPLGGVRVLEVKVREPEQIELERPQRSGR